MSKVNGPLETATQAGGYDNPSVQSPGHVPTLASATKPPSQLPSQPLRVLMQAVRTCPIPTTPIVQSTDAEERGLVFLELEARLPHLTRQTENLAQHDKGHLERSFSFDVDLSRLSERHYKALGQDSSSSPPPSSNVHDHASWQSVSHVWIPIYTQYRGDLAAIIVRDSDGQILPRMSSEEISSAYASGLVKLFRMLLETSGKTTATDDVYVVRQENHRARWLIESCIIRLIREGETISPSSTIDGHIPEDTEAQQIRGVASRALKQLVQLNTPSFEAFEALLLKSTLNYPLIILVPTMPRLAFVEFTAPPIPGAEEPHLGQMAEGLRGERFPRFSVLTRLGARLARMCSPVRVYQSSYRTQTSRAPSSYHLTTTFDPALRVRRFLASTDADVPVVSRLVSDIEAVAERYEPLNTVGTAILENELQAIAETISEIASSREAEARSYKDYIDYEIDRESTTGSDDLEKTGAGADKRSAAAVLDDFLNAQTGALQYLMEFSRGLHQGRYTRLVGILIPERLTRLANKVRELELGRSLLHDNDPRENGGHIYWHRVKPSRGSTYLDPISVQVLTVVVDDPPALGGSVRNMTIALVGIVAFIFTLASRNINWAIVWRPSLLTLNQSDAVVAVLLLVPGLLLTRLDIPETGSVLGQIRYQSRLLAFVAVGVLAALSGYVAAAPVQTTLAPVIAILILLSVIVVGAVSDHKTKRDGYESASRYAEVPEWVRREFPRTLSSQMRPPIVRFHSTHGFDADRRDSSGD